MEQKHLKPVSALADIVEGIWIQHLDAPAENRSASSVVPTGTVEILFHYGDLISHLVPDGVVPMPRTYVTGQRSRPVSVIGTGCLQAVIVSLYPWGLRTLFPGTSELTDGYFDLRLLDCPEDIECLEEQLSLANATSQRVQLVQEFLLRIRYREFNPGMIAATKLLACPGLERPIKTVTDALGISERHFSRQFKAAIGIQPGLFMRIMRFQSAIRARRESGLSWTSIAADCGYSDQPHLIREIRRFAGQKPGQIILDSGPGNSTFNGANASEFFDTVYL